MSAALMEGSGLSEAGGTGEVVGDALALGSDVVVTQVTSGDGVVVGARSDVTSRSPSKTPTA
ncbi:MAG: hypothetical protein ABUL56_03690, partial [Actinomycetota bacterium]